MRAGNAYHRIDFYEKVITRDSYGASADTWDLTSPLISTRGEIRYTGGGRTLESEEKVYTKNIELIVRYRPEIAETMKIQIDNTPDLWLIGYIETIGRNQDLRLTIERANDGIKILTDDSGFWLTNDAGAFLTNTTNKLITV